MFTPVNPASINFALSSSVNFVVINSYDTLRNLRISPLLNSPLKPRYSLSNTKSISSENRCIRFQPLLNEVPPLKINAGAHFIEKIIDSVCTTHQSFSIAISCKPTFRPVSLNTFSLVESDNCNHSFKWDKSLIWLIDFYLIRLISVSIRGLIVNRVVNDSFFLFLAVLLFFLFHLLLLYPYRWCEEPEWLIYLFRQWQKDFLSLLF